MELGRSGDALIARGDALVEALVEQGLGWAAMLVRLHTARALVRRGDLEAAGVRLAGVRLGRRAPLAVRLLASDVRAELAAAAGRRVEARRHLRVGLRDLNSWQSTFGSLDLQTLVAGHGARVARRGLRLAEESGRPGVLFEWSERARMLASRVAPVRAPADAAMAVDLAELRRLAPTATGPNSAGERDAELRRRVRAKGLAVARLGRSLRAVPTLRGPGRARGGHRPGRVRRAAGPDRRAGRDPQSGRVRRPHRPDPAARGVLGGLLPDLDMAASVEGLPDQMIGAIRSELIGRLGDLAQLLVAPVLPIVGDRSVVITPSGVLAGVPWPLLAGFSGRPVTVAQSATSWLRRQASPLRMRSAGFVVGPHVPRAAEEVASASAAWPDAVVLSGEAATAAGVTDLAARSDVLHIAAHGRHAAQNPMFSGLELIDGAWFGYDIDQLPAVPDVVLLSACEVGRSTVRYGEELIGMTAAWLRAGARCVIASAASVNDDVAHDVLVEVHRGLGAGRAPADALAAAVPLVGVDAPPAPFVCFG